MYTEVTKIALSTGQGSADFTLTIEHNCLRLEAEERYDPERSINVILDYVDLTALQYLFARAAELTNADTIAREN